MINKNIINQTAARVAILELLESPSNLLKLTADELKSLKVYFLSKDIKTKKYLKNTLGLELFNIVKNFINSIKFINVPYFMQNGLISSKLEWIIK
jgi:hypothetical protein